MKTYFSSFRSLLVVATSGNCANIVVPRKCILESIEISGGMLSDAAAGIVQGEVICALGGTGNLTDSDSGKVIGVCSALVRSAVGSLDSGVTFNKFSPIKLPMAAQQVIVTTMGVSANGRLSASVIYMFSY